LLEESQLLLKTLVFRDGASQMTTQREGDAPEMIIPVLELPKWSSFFFLSFSAATWFRTLRAILSSCTCRASSPCGRNIKGGTGTRDWRGRDLMGQEVDIAAGNLGTVK
jgi:hypothetical protein